MHKAIRGFVICWLSAACLEAGFVPLSLSSVSNTTFQTFPLLLNGNLFPTGSQTYGGVPFTVDPTWSADVAAGGAINHAPVQVTIPINAFGVSTVYTLMNSEWGATGFVEDLIFTFGDGSTYTVGLVANEAIRDYNNYTWTNTISNSWTAPLGMINRTVQVWSDVGLPCNVPGGICSVASGYQRLDEQIINIPAVYQNLTLVSLTILDGGDHATIADALLANPTDAQRSFISGLTVSAVATIPEPGTLALLLGGAGAIVALRKRRAR